MALSPGERIADLCSERHITQKKLAKKIGVSEAHISRIICGETRTLSSDILIAIANELKVSADYILWLSDICTRKTYDIFELGFTEDAAKGLVTGAVDMDILNRLLEHMSFPYLLSLIRIYLHDTAKAGIMARNQIIEMATASLSDMMKNRPENRTELRRDMQLLNAQKLGEHEAEMEKIKSMFLAILRDIKKDMDTGIPPGEPAAAMLQAVQEEIKGSEEEPPTMDDITEAVMTQLGQFIPMDEATGYQFQQLMKSVMTKTGERTE